MIERKTKLDQIEVAADGTVRARFLLMIFEDGVEDLDARRYHRTLFSPDVPVAAQFAEVNRNLALMKRAPITQADMLRVKAHADLEKG